MRQLIIQRFRHGATEMKKLVIGGRLRIGHKHIFCTTLINNCYLSRYDSGMVGQLIRNEVELGATPLFMTVDRVSIIQYIASPTPTGSRFIFRSPKLSYTDNVYILPFDEFVWYCLLLLIFVTAVFLTISILIEWRCFLPKYAVRIIIFASLYCLNAA